MSDLFDRLIEPLLAREGGYSNHPNDAGGATRFGVTEAVARENGYFGPMAALSQDQAKAIYRARYWVRPGLHLIAPLSAAVAEELFDTGINMGTGVAALFLQRTLNALNRQAGDYADIPVDGGVGARTAEALRALLAKRGKVGEAAVLRALNALQGARYIELAEQRGANESFVLGWLMNRTTP